MNYYLLIKREGLDAKGQRLTARQSASVLLERGIWPLWEHTKNRKAIAAGDLVAVYLLGDGGGKVIASARGEQVTEWSSALKLNNIRLLPEPLAVKERLSRLSFVNASSKKWGDVFMGGCRSIGKTDFGVLTSSAS